MLDKLLAQKRINKLDQQLAQLLSQHEAPEQQHNCFYLVLLLMHQMKSQHSCLELNKVNWQNPFALVTTATDEPLSPFATQFDPLASLQTMQCVSDNPNNTPLVLFAGRLYLARYFGYEQQLAAHFKRLNQQQLQLDEARLSQLLADYFPATDNEIDWQKIACALAATSSLCVLSGGPGTGKTTTVTRLLAILQSLYQNAPLNIELVAPTGKAAARLSESILSAKHHLKHTSEAVKALIPEQAQTLHRLLGVKGLSNQFRHHKNNPLHLDLVIVDEASMIDLSLMAKLFDALPEHAKVVLLGDKDQLSAVECGNIMADLCADCHLGELPIYSQAKTEQLQRLCAITQPISRGQASHFQLIDNIAFLQKSHRFDAQSGIGQLALAVNQGNVNQALRFYQQPAADLSFYPLQEGFYSALLARVVSHYRHYLTLIAQGASATQVHEAFLSYQLLAAVREGAFGVKQLNQQIEQALVKAQLINTSARFYSGMPIMISQNDYQLKLFNGDIGIVMADDSGELKAMFVDATGQVRAFFPSRLPRFDTVFAMTIHKSQGSEFTHTAMILPPLQQVQQGINKQLVYTGITRAKQHFELIADKNVLAYAINNPIERGSGLYQQLQNSALPQPNR